jgi:tetratricopeptide (TPR) repeat protein
MKKYLALVLAISISIGAVAQMGKVTSAISFMDQGALDKAKEALDLALANEKSMNNPKTYVAKGRLCQEAFKSDNPKFKAMYNNPLEEAYNAYEKALSLDPKGGTKKQFTINSTYTLLGNDFITQAVKQFEAQDYEGALKSFEFDINIASTDLFIGKIDTGIYFNAGIAALQAKSWDKAVSYFQKCADMMYGGTQPHLYMYQAYMSKRDTANAEKVLKKAFDVYPNDKDVILWLLDHYYRMNKVSEASDYLNAAKAKDPNNYSLYSVEGGLFMKQSKWKEAIGSLTKSVEIKEDNYDTQYNLGVCYYNIAVEMFQKANDIMDVAKYNAAVGEANNVFINAIPYFERAISIRPGDIML